MQQTYRIPSKLYFELYQKGGDKLIAAYSILKQSRNKETQYHSFTSNNNKIVSGYSLLRNKTNLTLHSLKKYVPILMDLGLCYFDGDGNFILLGNTKTKELYSSYKLVPIVIGKNLIHTAYNCFSVRIHSSEKQQNKKIQKNKFQSELRSKQNNPSTLKEHKAIQRLLRKEKRGFETDTAVLSIKGYALLKDSTNSKSKGSYWKSKLILNNIVESHKRFEKIRKMSFEEFLSVKSNLKLDRNFYYKNGNLVKELVSGLKTISL